MPLPTSPRKKDVYDILEHAEEQRNALMGKLDIAENGGHEPRFIVQDASNILSSAREVFDYLAKDIMELYILPNTKVSKYRTGYSKGELKIYFPFYPDQLKPGRPWHELKSINASLYNELHSFADALKNNSYIANTRFEGKMFIELQHMVNEKKHDKLLSAEVKEDQLIKITNPSMSMTFDRSDMKDISSVVASENGVHINIRQPTLYVQPSPTQYSTEGDVKMESGRAYYFSSNKKPVGKFSSFSLWGTRHVMDIFYKQFFA